jgi:hypothetical protein
MLLAEMLPKARALSRMDKLRLIQQLAEDLAQAEATSPFVADQTYPLWSPDRAYDAAAVLLRELEVIHARVERAGKLPPLGAMPTWRSPESSMVARANTRVKGEDIDAL